MKTRYQPPISIPKKYLSDIHYSGLDGRLVHLPMPKKPRGKKKTFIVLSGQHAAHERMYAIAELVNEYGEVYMPDLPGYGGMTSFYDIGITPSYDTYADYLYTFLKSHKLTKNLWFFANSFSSAVMTRMFQKYPETQTWTKQAIAFVGFGAASDFALSPSYKAGVMPFVWVGKTKYGAKLIDALLFNRLSMWLVMNVFSRVKAKMQSDDRNLREDMIRMEKYLWTVNDRRTHAMSAHIMFTEDLTDYASKPINLSLHNIVSPKDQYFNNDRVEKTMQQLYKGYETSLLNLKVHSPSMIATKQEVEEMLAPEAHALLGK